MSNLIQKKDYLHAYFKYGRIAVSYELQDSNTGNALFVFTSRSGKRKTDNILLAFLALTKDISIRCPARATIMIYERDYRKIEKYLAFYDHYHRFDRSCRRHKNKIRNKRIANMSFVIQQIISLMQSIQHIDIKIVVDRYQKTGG